MSFLVKTQLLNNILKEIVYVAPKNWREIIYYVERIKDKSLDLRRGSTAKCWLSPSMNEYNESQRPAIPVSFELIEAEDNLFWKSDMVGETWCGLVMKIDNAGKYISKFYYEGTPLLDGNDTELSKRLAEIKP
ncbi:hypothetical protein [Acinetobacter sp. NIPH 2100]|uniref:hypothetical protein n=1 Tax=Acinetobacter sp. NIPH 2100 TaxID=1217708 RepID=UPI0002D0DCE5|nr:hypothetical protein [Acinetobacter sp. NIPH 2100]ENX41613.1 hypothetical protein F887_02009 [Acinetobacter sp. NIPH 2100]